MQPNLQYKMTLWHVGVEISTAAQDSLLDLLCAYNSAEPKPALQLEELFYKGDLTPDMNVKKTQCTWRLDLQRVR